MCVCVCVALCVCVCVHVIEGVSVSCALVFCFTHSLLHLVLFYSIINHIKLCSISLHYHQSCCILSDSSVFNPPVFMESTRRVMVVRLVVNIVFTFPRHAAPEMSWRRPVEV